jgi:hypothetical protein
MIFFNSNTVKSTADECGFMLKNGKHCTKKSIRSKNNGSSKYCGTHLGGKAASTLRAKKQVQEKKKKNRKENQLKNKQKKEFEMNTKKALRSAAAKRAVKTKKRNRNTTTTITTSKRIKT